MSSERSKRRKVLEFTQWVRPEGTKVKYQAARHRGTRTLFGPARPSTARPEILLGRIGGGGKFLDGPARWDGPSTRDRPRPAVGPSRMGSATLGSTARKRDDGLN